LWDLKRERERERRDKVREVARETIFKGEEKETFFSPVLKVPRQCPLVLLVEICLREGKAFGTLEGLHYSEILI
jgi:hypothetical protein